jgi:DHA1 family multidrug resistance protein-like MFS transporter
MIMTFTVYMASAIWSPAVAIGAEHFGVSELISTLGITTFGMSPSSYALGHSANSLVVGYGVGPLFLSPLSEIPSIGRTTPYIICLLLFCAIQLPTAAVNHIAPFLVLRFLAGFLGSPPLATGG